MKKELLWALFWTNTLLRWYDCVNLFTYPPGVITRGGEEFSVSKLLQMTLIQVNVTFMSLCKNKEMDTICLIFICYIGYLCERMLMMVFSCSYRRVPFLCPRICRFLAVTAKKWWILIHQTLFILSSQKIYQFTHFSLFVSFHALWQQKRTNF